MKSMHLGVCFIVIYKTYTHALFYVIETKYSA